MNPALEAALRYIKEGIGVFPVIGKKPIVYDGFYSASTSEDVVKAWWGDNPDFGVAGRIPAWAVVLDVDKIGAKSLRENGFDVVDSASTKTKKGVHYWYELPPSTPNLIRKIRFLPDVDLLGADKGYAMMAPSKHPEDPSIRYEEIIPIRRSNMERAPDWIITAMAHDTSVRKGIDPEEFLKGLPEGSRQSGLFRYASCLRARPKMTLAEAKILVSAVAAASKWEEGDPIEIVERVWRTYAKAKEYAEAQEEAEKIFSWAELFAQNLEKPRFLVDNLIQAEGATMIFAPPKRFKSCAASQIAIHVAYGLPLWGRKVERSEVLLADIQQDKEAGFDRYGKQLRALGMVSFPHNLHSMFGCPPIDQGGSEQICKFLDDHPACGLVIVDTVKDVWPVELRGGNAYDQEKAALRFFTKIAKKYGIAILLVHHSNKNFDKSSDEFFQYISGTNAVGGDMKGVIGISGGEFDMDATFFVKGKNFPMQKLHLAINEEELIWRTT